MLFHASISAREPARVAKFLADIWQGKAFAFPPCEGGWVALSGDDRGTMMEIYPFGIHMIPGEKEFAYVTDDAATENSTSHQAIATDLSVDQVLARAEQEGWRALQCNRGPFEVVEVWLENRILVEVLTPRMQKQYLDFITFPNWQRFLDEVQ